MQKVDMAGFRKQLVQTLKETYTDILDDERGNILMANTGADAGAGVFEIPPIGSLSTPDAFIVRFEELLDEAMRDNGDTYEPGNGLSVAGRLEKYTLKDDFVLSIEVNDTEANNILLHQMKQDRNVHIVAAQGTLFAEGAEGTDEAETPDSAEQPALAAEESEGEGR